MRIAVLTNAYPPDCQGGAGRIAQVTTEFFRSRGHDVEVWGAGPDFHRLRQMGPVRRLFFHVRDVRANERLVQSISNWRPDVLFTHNLTGCGFATPQHLRRRGIRWVHVLHDVQLFEPSGQMIAGESFTAFHRVWRLLWTLLRRRGVGEPDVVVSPTRWLLDVHRAYGWFARTPSKIIPNFLVRSDHHIETRQEMLKTMLFVGRLDWDKGVDLFVDVANMLRGQISKAVMIGDGAWRDRLSSLNDEMFDVRGPQSSDEVERAMREAVVVVVPSRVCENQPTVILEALQAGCRIVATDVGGVRETIGDAGTIVQPNSSFALVEAIRDALVRSTDHAEDAARRRILALHDPSVVGEAFLGVFKSNL